MNLRGMPWIAVLALCTGLIDTACRVEPPPAGDRVEPNAPPVASPPAAAPTPPKEAKPVAVAALPSRFPAPERLVAFGDVHGDLRATRQALRLGGAIDDSDQWVGEKLIVVQTGDQLDRGDDEQEILDLFESVRAQAAAAGGAFHVLNGNHELMNAAGDLRYVTPGGFADFEGIEGADLSHPAAVRAPKGQRARVAAFVPGGPYAKILAQRNTVVVVGRSVFVHGGVLPQHVPDGVASLEKLNASVRAWLGGTSDGADLKPDVLGNEGVVWTRLYARDDAEACGQLGETLRLLDVDRMVIGHTVQENGITSGCDERVWRVDVGMAAHYGGDVQVLQIEGDTVQVLSLDG